MMPKDTSLFNQSSQAGQQNSVLPPKTVLHPYTIEQNEKATKFLQDLKRPEYSGAIPFLRTLQQRLISPELIEAHYREFEGLKQRILSLPLESRTQPLYDAVKNRSTDVLRDIYEIDVNSLAEDVHNLLIYELKELLNPILKAAENGTLTENHFSSLFKGLCIMKDAVRLNKPNTNYCMFKNEEEFKSLMNMSIINVFDNKLAAEKKAADTEGKDFTLILAEYLKARDRIVEVFCRYAPRNCAAIKHNFEFYLKKYLQST